MQMNIVLSAARSLLRHIPLVRSAAKRVYFSYQYRPVLPADVPRLNEELRRELLRDNIPGEHQRLAQNALALSAVGKSDPTFAALVDILLHGVPDVGHKTLLEIGCSTGHYSQVFRERGIGLQYSGCDISPSLIKLARSTYPSVPFDVQDATGLTYGDASYDIVLSGGCLANILDSERAIAEAARVARAYVVFHRTPVLHLAGPRFYIKRVYQNRFLDVHYNEQKLVRSFAAHGLAVIDINTHLEVGKVQHQTLFMKTYLCRKVAAEGSTSRAPGV